MNQRIIYTEDDLNDAGSNVLNSILDSRIDQVDAITLPIDQHRKDIIHAIQKIESYPKRLSSFLDYLIDYTYHLNLELSQKQDQLNETLDELALLKKSQRSKISDSKASSKHKNLSNIPGIEESNFEESINSLKKIQRKATTNTNDDYIISLKMLNAEEGNLHQALNLIVEENQELHKINSKLTSKIEKSSRANYYQENSLFANDYSFDSDKKVDPNDLKNQLNLLETDVIQLKKLFHKKISSANPKQ